MVFLISDIHGENTFPGLRDYIETATMDDLLIVLGDTGLNFEQNEENKEFTQQFLSIDKKIALIDGNHENFEYLNSFPEENWNGGVVKRLSENIILLRRGNIYTINGKTFFAFGGCKSSPKWKEMGLWYPGEEPSEEEIRLAHLNLEKHNFNVDYILTHKYEQSERGTVCLELKKLTEFIDKKVKFKKWYSGHWHMAGEIDDKHAMIYDELTPLE